MKMTKQFLTVFIAMISVFVYASNEDRIITNSGEVIKGEVIKLGKNYFKINTTKGTIKVSNDKVAIVSFGQELSVFEKMQLGELDGKRYAKRKGGNIVLGFFTGLIGTGIVYLTSSQYPGFEASNGPNKAIVNDPAYLEGFKKGAKAKSGGSALIGTGAWVLLLLLASAG